MPSISLGRHDELDHARYAVKLSSGKRLILFRLPTIKSKTTSTKEIAKANEVGGWSYYAMEAECPHAGGPMGNAQIEIEDDSYIASCPWHAYDFNVETGESSYGMKACTFPITSDQGKLLLRFDEDGVGLSTIEPISEDVKFKHDPKPNTDKTPLPPGSSVCDWCVHILNTSDPEAKIELTTQLFTTFATLESTDSPMPITSACATRPPDIPPRPATLQVLPPGRMPNPGKGGTLRSRITMLHALANIEQWAIDLALDICIRFAAFATQTLPPQPLPRTFFHDWLRVAHDEAKHFSLLRARLEALGSRFGALPVHHGLWDSAAATAHDLRARISVIALVHEARGLDVNPLTMDKFRRAGDGESVEVLGIIHADEVTHVTTGHRWLSWICEVEGTDAVRVFRGNVRRHFMGAVRGPFNGVDRGRAGMGEEWYTGLDQGVGGREVIAGG